MRVIRIKLHNLMSFADYEIAPGRFTLVDGKNAAGKTAVIEAIKALVKGGHDATLIRQGADEAEVVLDLSDDALEGPIRLSKKITPEGSKVTVQHPEMGRLTGGQAYINKLIPALSLSPVDFLVADEAKQVSMVLAALPLKITSEQIATITGQPEHAESYRHPCEQSHALLVLAEVEKAQYDQRTGVNRALKDKLSSLRELQATLPADAQQPGQWSERLEQLEQQLMELTAEHTAATVKGKEEHETAKRDVAQVLKDTQARQETDRHSGLQNIADRERADIEAVRARYAAERQGLERTGEAARRAAQEIHDRDLNIANSHAECIREEITHEYEPRMAALNEELGTARARVEQEAGYAKQLEIVQRMQRDTERYEAESARLTKAVEGIRKLRDELTATLPVQGLEIRDGVLCLDGLPFRRVNEARRIQVAMELVRLQAGKLPFVVVDGAEALDSASLAALAAEAERAGLQVVATRVRDEELHVTDLR